MAIISQESFDKFTEEEKAKIRGIYKDMKDDVSLAHAHEYAEKCEWLEDYFGKENLQPEPKIKTWKDVKDKSDSAFQTSLNLKYACDGNMDNKLSMKIKATYKIAKIIELGYGGVITDEEWEDNTCIKYYVVLEINKGRNRIKEPSIHCDYEADEKHFIAFHTEQQAEEFMSYPENVKLVEQYYMI